MTRLGALLAVIVLGCAKETERPQDLELVPQTGRTSTQPAPAPRADCVNLSPAKVSLSGVLRVEEHRGPPGYGETPKLDTRDTIVVLVTEVEVAACGDSTLGPDAVAKVRTNRFQLGRISRDMLRQPGARVTVFGELRHRVWGSQRTEIVIDVDSIPALRQRSQSST